MGQVRDTNLPRTPVTGMFVVASALVAVALPFFMVGGLAVQIRAELGLNEATFGAGVTVGFLVGAMSAPICGRVADRIGARPTIYLGCAISVAALAGLGLLTNGFAALVGFLCIGGVGIALTDPGLAILVSRGIPTHRQGLAFGVKEASIPAAALVAGLAVPAIALTVGWRWAFLTGVIPVAVVLIGLPRMSMSPDPPRAVPDPAAGAGSPPNRNALFLVALAAALGTTAGSGAGIFLTGSAVAMGMSPGNAGLLLATGSLAGIVARVTTGMVADRSGGPQFRLIAAMLAGGALAMALGGTGNTALLVLATIGAFTGGWAWTGIYFLSLVRTSPHRPGAVAGIGSAGLGLGNAAGPLLFGLVAGSVSYAAAWLGAALVAGLASILMTVARKRF
ncbi:MAG TPA: MFS transporter [Acidimicrobiia bacterium]|nr:MFS transporter [Acidimicrobiia bacterium]